MCNNTRMYIIMISCIKRCSTRSLSNYYACIIDLDVVVLYNVIRVLNYEYVGL